MVEILADSINPYNNRLTTMRVEMPRFVLAEFNTHRVFSRNAGSSRAISTTRRIQMIRDNPVVPVEWGLKTQSMHATQQLNETDQLTAFQLWKAAENSAITAALALDKLGVHKQIVNRLLEPFCHVQVIVTSSDFSNFFTLRTSEKAQPEIRQLALEMQKVYNNHVPRSLNWGEWHAPFSADLDDLEGSYVDWKKVAVGRLARVSYESNPKHPEVDEYLANQLIKDGHWSPFEHLAKAVEGEDEMCRNFNYGWAQYRAMVGG